MVKPTRCTSKVHSSRQIPTCRCTGQKGSRIWLAPCTTHPFGCALRPPWQCAGWTKIRSCKQRHAACPGRARSVPTLASYRCISACQRPSKCASTCINSGMRQFWKTTTLHLQLCRVGIGVVSKPAGWNCTLAQLPRRPWPQPVINAWWRAPRPRRGSSPRSASGASS